jgi:hypothetical protein
MTETHGAVCTHHNRSWHWLTWADFTHDMARSRAFRWGEDGIAGVTDSHGQQNIAFAFWNEKEYVRRSVAIGIHANISQRLLEGEVVWPVESSG